MNEPPDQPYMRLIPRRLFNFVLVVIGASMVLSLLVAMSASTFLRNAPRAADPATGHIIPLALRGLGTRYMTTAEWNSILWYWDVFSALLGLLIASLVARLVLEGYKGFMRGWRSDEDRR